MVISDYVNFKIQKGRDLLSFDEATLNQNEEFQVFEGESRIRI